MTTTKSGPLVNKFDVRSPDSIGYLNFLMYGHAGSGKTYLGGTAQNHPKTRPMLILDVEGGTTTLREHKDIDVIQVRSPQQVKEIHDELRENNNGHYKTVMIDSLTELQKLDMRSIMLEVIQKRPDQDVDVPSMREWGKSSEHIRRIVRAFRDLEMNTIFTALMVDYKDEKTGQVTFYPSVPGKLKAEVPGFLDVVGYLHVDIEEGEVIRTIQFAQTAKIIAKDRTGALGDKLVNPTIPQMFDLIYPTSNGAKSK